MFDRETDALRTHFQTHQRYQNENFLYTFLTNSLCLWTGKGFIYYIILLYFMNYISIGNYFIWIIPYWECHYVPFLQKIVFTYVNCSRTLNLLRHRLIRLFVIFIDHPLVIIFAKFQFSQKRVTFFVAHIGKLFKKITFVLRIKQKKLILHWKLALTVF